MLLEMICAAKKGVGMGIIGASYIPTYAGKGLVAAGTALIAIGDNVRGYGESVCEGADIAAWAAENVTGEDIEKFKAQYGIKEDSAAVELMYRMTHESTKTDISVEKPEVVLQPEKKAPGQQISEVLEEDTEEEEEPPHILAARLC